MRAVAVTACGKEGRVEKREEGGVQQKKKYLIAAEKEYSITDSRIQLNGNKVTLSRVRHERE